MKNNKKKILGIGLLVVLAALMVLAYTTFREKPVEGSKAITIQVVNSAESATLYEVKTDAEYLLQAMEQAQGLTFEGEDGPFGLTIYTINGETANYNVNGAYWAFYVNDDYCNYGVSQQPVEDGDAFQIVYTLG